MEAWRPRTEAWQPFFDPTLIQALQANSLREQMRPIITTAMRDAFGRGEALRTDLLSQVTKGPETLFIADLPGPEAVAFGAGLASWADLVPEFANWPHPFGVVRSHETLAALLYYAAYVQERKKQLPASAPGILLLDSRRLESYTDDGKQFDNRYVAAVPPVSALQQRGIKHVLYITPDRQQRHESDDLNDDFVAYRDANIQVALFPLGDLQKTTEAVAKKAPDGSTRTVQEPRYYYGGGWSRIWGFYSSILFWRLDRQRIIPIGPMGVGDGRSPGANVLDRRRHRQVISQPRVLLCSVARALAAPVVWDALSLPALDGLLCAPVGGESLVLEPGAAPHGRRLDGRVLLGAAAPVAVQGHRQGRDHGATWSVRQN
jgi:hypothetical protein